MATIKFGNGWADARGKVGGVVYARNRYGSYARNFTKPTNPSTPAQVTARNRFSYISSSWRLLTQAQQDSWIQAAQFVAFPNKVGELIKPTGNTYFNKLNGMVFSAGGDTIATEPSQLVDIVGVINATLARTVVADAVTVFTADVTLVDGTQIVPADHTVKIFSTGAISAGINRPADNLFTAIGNFDAAADMSDLSVLTMYTDTFGAPVVGTTTWLSFEVRNLLTGQASQRFKVAITF